VISKELAQALLFCARLVRFCGPDITNFPTSIDQRLHNVPAANVDRLCFVWAIARSWHVTGDYTPVTNGIYVAAAEAQAPLQARPGFPNAQARAALRAQLANNNNNVAVSMFDTMPRMSEFATFNQFMASLTTNEMIMYLNLMNGFDATNSFGWGAETASNTGALTPAGAIRAEKSLPAGGLDGVWSVQCCTGIKNLISRFLTGGAESAKTERRHPIYAPLTADMYLQRLYSLSALIRSAADVSVYATRSSRATCDAGVGYYNTGSQDLDALLGFFSNFPNINRRTANILLTDHLVSSCIFDIGGSLMDAEPLNADIPFNSVYSVYVLPMCFNPIVNQLLLGKSLMAGGMYDIRVPLVRRVFQQAPGYLWNDDQCIKGMSQTEVIGLFSSYFAIRGRRIEWAAYVEAIDPNDNQPLSGYVNISPMGSVHRCEQLPSMIGYDLPISWWVDHPYDGCRIDPMSIIAEGNVANKQLGANGMLHDYDAKQDFDNDGLRVLGNMPPAFYEVGGRTSEARAAIVASLGANHIPALAPQGQVQKAALIGAFFAIAENVRADKVFNLAIECAPTWNLEGANFIAGLPEILDLWTGRNGCSNMLRNVIMGGTLADKLPDDSEAASSKQLN